MSASALDIVHARVSAELGRERAAGRPFKAAYAAVARRFGITARRVRAFHHGEVAADDVRAAELLAADEAWRRDIAALKARLQNIEGLSHEVLAGGPGAVASGEMGGPRAAVHEEVGGLAPAAGPLEGVVRE